MARIGGTEGIGAEMERPSVFDNMPATPDEMIVCSVPRWPYADMAAGAAGRFPVRHDLGLWLPEVPAGATVAWWAPAEHATRLVCAGIRMDLCAPGPAWLAEVPDGLTGRPVWAGTLRGIHQAPRAGFAKLAEAKLPDLPARWYDDTADFARAAAAAGVPGGSWVQVSPVRLDLVEEHRAFVLAGAVRAASPYLLAGGSTWEPGFDEREDLHHAEARDFAQDVADELGGLQPGAYALDVGLCASGRWVVVEANPAWCSGTYGANLPDVVDTVVASSLTAPGAAGSHGSWAWRPDACLLARAERKPLALRAVVALRTGT